LSLIELARLTAGQAELLTDYHRRWEGVRMSTARADRRAAESGIVKAYRRAALAPPERVVWCNGPLDVARSAKDASLQSAGENVKALIVDRTIREATHAADRTVSNEVRGQIGQVFRRRPINPVSTAVTAAVTLDNRVANGEAQPRSLRLRRRKGMENAAYSFRIEARPCVMHCHNNCIVTTRLADHVEHPAAAGRGVHSFDGVANKIEDYLLQLASIAVNERQLG